MERANPHGAGVAWPVIVEDGSIKIAYRKGLTAVQVHKILQELHTDGVGPVLFHFRWATVGGQTPLLTHPFPLEEHPHLALEGEASAVLIHNGHWSEWDGIMKSNPDLFDPNEKTWSDTRVGAHLLSMGLIKQSDMGGKVAVLTAPDMEVRKTGDWTDRDGVLYSNTYWDRVYTPHHASHVGPYTPTHHPGYKGRKKGQSGQHAPSDGPDADGKEHTEWWERMNRDDTPPTGTRVQHITGLRECLMCECWVSTYRVLSTYKDKVKDNERWVVCPECDWDDEVNAQKGEKPTTAESDGRLFTDEELAARPIRTIGGVLHVQAPTGEWHPIPAK